MRYRGHDDHRLRLQGYYESCLAPTGLFAARLCANQGRGTRKFTFAYKDENGAAKKADKDKYKFFDFFANFEYFEEKFNYDEVLVMPVKPKGAGGGGDDDKVAYVDQIEIFDPDKIRLLTQTLVGVEGMKVDRKLFERAKEKIQQDKEVKQAVAQEQWEKAIKILRERYENQPELYLTLYKIRKSENLDRRLTWREFLERTFGLIDAVKSKNEKLEEEVDKFISIHKPESQYVPHIRNYLKAYVTDERFREIINCGSFAELNVYPGFSMGEFKALGYWRKTVPEYVKDYVPLNQYM